MKHIVSLLVLLILFVSSCSKNAFETPSSFHLINSPATGSMTIIGQDLQYYMLFDELGQLVQEGEINSDHYIFDVSAIPPGNYLLNVTADNQTFHVRVSVTDAQIWGYPNY